MSLTKAPEDTPERRAYREKIARQNLSPLWTVLSDLITPEPKSACRPHMWRYGEVRDTLMEAGRLITAREAERRVLILENPGMAGESRVTTSLYAGLQLVLPGEIAPSHRHSQSALRFIMEGDGAYTAVDGEKAFMKEFDLILTPNYNADHHDHVHLDLEPGKTWFNLH